jgi:hypothetical protein
MRSMLAVAVMILSAVLAPTGQAATPVEAKLTLPHDHVLPGIPFDIVVTYTNVSDRPVTISGAGATLIVTFADGETTVMHTPEGHDRWTLRSLVPSRLQPGESMQQAASWDHGSIPNWFRYSSFSGPGVYGVALDLAIFDESTEPITSVRTSAVTLTVIEPVGIDAALWKRMQEVSEGRWADASFMQNNRDYATLADEIRQLHPESGYYPYVLALRAFRPDKNHIPALLEAAERFQDSPAYPYLLAAAANCARYAGAVAAQEGNAIEAQKYFTLAETKYRAALATPNSVVIRPGAEDGLHELTWRREQLEKKQAR